MAGSAALDAGFAGWPVSILQVSPSAAPKKQAEARPSASVRAGEKLDGDGGDQAQ